MRFMLRRPLVPLIAVITTLLTAPVATAAVPQGFVGVNIGGPFFYPDFDQNGQMSQMVSSGVESVRVLVNWSQMQPYASFARVPTALRGQFQNVGGVPTNFGQLDSLVRLGATHRLTLLGQVEYSPSWDSVNPRSAASPPKSPGPYGRFVHALAQRYGTRGTFWAANPGVAKDPIRVWQIWNEPDFPEYWSKQPFERSYVQLLRAAHSGIKSADPAAKVILAGLPNFSWMYLAKIYQLGARRLFDGVAVHPYTHDPSGVITILQRVRAVMDRWGDRGKPMYLTELSWPSAKGEAVTLFENATTESGQAQKVSQAIQLLAKNRARLNLAAFYYYTWITDETMPKARVDPFNFAGLLRFIDNVGTSAKPALAAFSRAALSVEGCRSKSQVATNCAR
jgi:hypothetical protein